MISWPRESVLQACRQYAPLLPDMGDVDGARLLAAIAMKESSLGADCDPRHEPSWDIGGEYASNPQQAKNLQLYPYAAACSYTPLQIMFYNCPGCTPDELNTDLALGIRVSVYYMSRQINRWKIDSVRGVSEMWNWGHPERPFEVVPLEVLDYCNDVAGYYLAAEAWT